MSILLIVSIIVAIAMIYIYFGKTTPAEQTQENEIRIPGVDLKYQKLLNDFLNALPDDSYIRVIWTDFRVHIGKKHGDAFIDLTAPYKMSPDLTIRINQSIKYAHTPEQLVELMKNGQITIDKHIPTWELLKYASLLKLIGRNWSGEID